MPKPKPRNIKRKSDIAAEIAAFRTTLPKHSTLSAIIGTEETKSIWFSFEQVQEMWEEIIYQAVNNRKNVSGVRVYLTTYLAGSNFENQLGVVFVLTENVGTLRNPKHKDFFIEEQPDYPNRPASIVDPETSGVSNLDHGSPCPPDCSITQDPEWP